MEGFMKVRTADEWNKDQAAYEMTNKELKTSLLMLVIIGAIAVSIVLFFFM